jgi:hypothetical protein
MKTAHKETGRTTENIMSLTLVIATISRNSSRLVDELLNYLAEKGGQVTKA